MTQEHLIGKQILQLEVDSSKDAYAIQQKMSQLVWRELLPALESLFDNLVHKDLMIRLDTIEIDIGNINLGSGNTNEIVNRIIKLLKETLEDKLRSINNREIIKRTIGKDQFNKGLYSKQNTFSGEVNQNSEIINQNGNGYAKRTDRKENVIVPDEVGQSRRRYYFDAWLYWLQKGVLPSYVITPDDNWIKLVLETLGVDLNAVTILENKLKRHPIAIQRLVLQHSAQDLKSIVELYTGFSQTYILEFLKELKSIHKEQDDAGTPSISSRNLEVEIWKQIFEIIILDRQKLDSIVLGRKVINHAILTEAIYGFEIRKIVRYIVARNRPKDYPILIEVLNDKALVNQIDSIEESTSLDSSPEVKEENPKTKTRVEEEIKSSKEIPKEDTLENELLNTDRAKELKSKKQEVEFEKEELESPQFFNNAGVVLLHPFLSSFFNKLDLLKGNDFVDFKAKSKAIVLLHFLATGQDKPKEYEMVLPKFLCEMEANMPVDHTIQISKEEKEEANNVLQAVISHWGALGDVSSEGLREGFLMRDGKLEKEQTGWKLFIEQKTMDILLDKLPWNLSLIKLPWMKEILKVEWR